MTSHALLVAVHLLGLLLWSSGILGGARVLALRELETDGSARSKLGAVARSLGVLGDVGLTVAVGAGVTLLLGDVGYLKQHWMHAKLTLVLGLLGLHGFVRGRGVKAATDPAVKSPAWMFPGLLALAAGIVFLAVGKP